MGTLGPMRVAGKPTVPDVLPLTRALYASEWGSVGCCLHTVLDDTNIDNHSVHFCLERARAQDHPLCLQIAALLLLMSHTQRRTVCYRTHRL